MELRFICDIHLEGPHQFKGWSFERVMDEYTPDTYIGGDLYSLDSCKRRKLGKILKQQQQVIDRYKENYVAGNHCRFNGKFIDTSKYYVIRDGVLITHLDWRVFWPLEKTFKWENKTLGMKPFKRFNYTIYKKVNFANPNKPFTPKLEILENVDNLVDFIEIQTGIRVKAVTGGHRHKYCDVMTPEGTRFVTNTKGLSLVTF